MIFNGWITNETKFPETWRIGNGKMLSDDHLGIFLGFWGSVYLVPNQKEWWRERLVLKENRLRVRRRKIFLRLKGDWRWWEGVGSLAVCMAVSLGFWNASDGPCPETGQCTKWTLELPNIFYLKNSPVNSWNKRLGWICGIYKAMRHGDNECQKRNTNILRALKLKLKQGLDLGE